MYAYCKNNLVNGSDPTGHWSWKDVFKTAAIVTGAALVVVAIVASGGSAAPPLLAAASAAAGTAVSAGAVATAAAEVALTGFVTMGVAATATIMESNENSGKDYVKARNNKQANDWAQDVGYDGAESLKADYVGKEGSKFNMYRNRATEEIVLIGFRGVLKGVEVFTELFLNK